MKQYKLIKNKYDRDLMLQVNELALKGWRLVNFHVVVAGMFEMYYAAMEKDL